jgi:hypothetical protein
MSLSPEEVRINARLTGGDAALLRELLDRSGGLSVSEVLRAALREYHRAHVRPQGNPLELLAGYIGSVEGPQDLSVNYKSYLAQALEDKIPFGVQEPPAPGYGSRR